MESDRIKWNERYSGEGYLFSLTPSRFLAASLDQVGARVWGRRALDVACGEGRNALFLAEKGFEVDAVDVSEKGLERGRRRAEELGLKVNFIRADLEQYRLERGYDLIVDFNFLFRPLIPAMVESLNPGGVVVMESILNGPNLQGHHTGEFLLQPGELERLFAGHPGRILLVEEDPTAETPLARIIYQKHFEA